MFKSAYLLLIFLFFLNCNFFTDDLEPGEIIVYTPVANSEYSAGDTVYVKWHYTDGGYYDAEIKLYRNGVFEQTINSYYYVYGNDTSSYGWRIPTSIESDSTYQIMVEHYDYYDLNDLSGIFTIKGIDADTFEVDDKYTQANELMSGSTQMHSLLYNDSDWVKIYVKSGNLYKIFTEANFTHYVYLYDNVNSSYKKYDSGTSTSINYTATSDDTLFVLVKHYSSSSSTKGNYSIKAEAVEADSFEVDNFYSQANMIHLDSTQHHSIISTDTDWMKLPVKAGNVYSVTTSSDINHYLSLYLDPEASTNKNTSGTDNILNITPTVDDTLYIKVNYYSNSISYYGNYDITVSVLTNDSYEDDNSYENANLIFLDSVQKHSIIGNDSDWVKIPVSKDVIYKVTTNASVSHYLFLYEEPLIGYIAYKNSNNNTLYYSATNDDTLFVMIKNYSSSTSYSGNYSIVIDTLDNSNSDIFISPSAGSTLKVSSSSYSIKWDDSNELLSNSLNLYLYRNGRTVSTITSYISNYGSYSWTVPSYIESGDNYRIKLVNNYDSQELSFFSDTFTIAGQTPDAYEDDDSKSLAKLISADTIQNRTIIYGDSDWVKLPVVGGKTYKFKTSSNISLYFSLHKKTGTSAIKSTSGSNNSLIYNAIETDTIYAAVSVSSSYKTPYAYLLETSTVLEDTLLIFEFPKAGDTINTLADTTITYSNYSSYGSYLYLYLYAGDSLVKTLSASSQSNDGSYSWKVPESIESGNNYRLYIKNSNGDKFAFSDTFCIKGLEKDSYENDNSIDSATLITVPQKQNHTVTINDSDWVTFSADSGMIYTINTNSLFNHYLKIYNTKDSQCLDSVYNTNGNITYSSSKNETIYALVSNANSIGNYSIEVKRYHPDSLVKFTEPTLGSVYSAGSTYQLEWDLVSSLFSGYAYVYLYKGTNAVMLITNYNPSTDNKTYNWSIPENLETGSNYSIYVQNSTSTPTIQIISDTFSISGITADAYEDDDSIITANQIGIEMETHTLTIGDKDWFTFNGVKDSVYVFDKASSETVKLYLFSDSGTVSKFSTTSSKEVWLCTETAPYHFYIEEYNNSDANGYTIKLSQYSTNQNLLPVTVPGEGDTLNAGSSVNITWGNNSVFGGYVDIFLYKDGQLSSTVKSSLLNSGSYSWFIPSSTVSGVYSLKIVSRESSKIIGTSKSFYIE